MKRIFITLFLVTFILGSFLIVVANDRAKDAGDKSGQIDVVQSIDSVQVTKEGALFDFNCQNSKTLPDQARRGCCSHHGGVCGCDNATDSIKCCDGTLSPSCTCSGY